MIATSGRALVYRAGSREPEILVLPRLRPDVDEVMVRVLAVGLTRKDFAIVRSGVVLPPEGEDHLVLGHVAVGRVEEVGPLVKTLTPGDLVVPVIRRDCNRCIDARSDLCPHPEWIRDCGLDRAHGFARDFLVEKPRYLIRVPQELADLALLLPHLSMVEKAHHDMVEVRHRFNFYCYHEEEPASPWTLITGLGPVGCLTSFLLSLYNYRLTVFCRREVDDTRAEILRPLNLEYVNTTRQSVSHLEKSGYRFRLLFETTGDPAFILDLLSLADANASAVLMGNPGRQRTLSVDASNLLQRMISGNLMVFGSTKSGRDAFEAAVKQMVELSDLYRPNLLQLLSARFPLEEFRKAFSLGTRDAVLPVLTLA